MASKGGVIVKIFPNTYRDSIQLLKAASDVQKFPGVKQSAMMMGTPANKKMMVDAIAQNGGDANYANQAISEAQPGDLILTIVAENDQAANDALQKSAEVLDPKARSGGGKTEEDIPTTISQAVQKATEEGGAPNLAIISVPGDYAATEAKKALANGMHVLLFSDNVSGDDEKWLKEYADPKNLLLMGPDCGTAILDRVPLGFANVCKEGSIGFVGASGTGLQQVTTLVDQLGEGITQIIGVGGHDLSDKIGGLMMLQGMRRLEADPSTSVIVLVSKPPSPSVSQKVIEFVKASKKPYVIMFIGMDASKGAELGKHAAVADTLESAALLAAGILQGKKPNLPDPNSNPLPTKAPGKDKIIKGLFSGGTFNSEAKTMLTTLVGKDKFNVIDLGDDEYTVGRPHPMIDFTLRNEFIAKAADAPDTAAILIDVVLGYGAHEDPAGAIAPALDYAKKKGIPVFAHVCGTNGDPQNLNAQVQRLNQTGAIVFSTNAQAVRGVAGFVTGKKIERPELKIPSFLKATRSKGPASKMMPDGVNAINLGLPQFTIGPQSTGAKIQHINWKPPAGGDPKLGRLVSVLLDPNEPIFPKIQEANKLAVDKITGAHPILRDVLLARDAIPGLGNKKIILHSGPPIAFNSMCGPMSGAVLGAIVFEGWANNLDDARRLAESGEVQFAPCHEFGAVGPMAGITSPSMPVFVVQNDKEPKNVAFSNMNEGLGKVLRFGANDVSVIDRLQWMSKILGPTLHLAIRALEKPIDLKGITMQALQMGDECHNRNAAATLMFVQQISPALISLARTGAAPLDQVEEVLRFMYGNAHFFLNMSMASAKVVLDAGSNVPFSTVATVMCRNGVDFGLRLSGTGNQWFTAPSPKVDGLYFPGYSMADSNPDMGDSSITETSGIGGFAMAAAPAITGFVGGSANDALKYTTEMYKICERRHPDYKIPSLDYAGVAVGIDARLVLETGILPIINTGIAHKQAGIGQIGAGITRAPVKVFTAALGQYATTYLQKRNYSTYASAYHPKNHILYRSSSSQFTRTASSVMRSYTPRILSMIKRKL